MTGTPVRPGYRRATIDTTLFQNLLTFFEGLDWPIEQMPGESILAVNVQGDSGLEFNLIASSDEPIRQLLFFTRAPFEVPAERRSEMVPLLNRINFRLNAGAWTLDESDGELRFRHALLCGEEEPSHEAIRRAAGYPIVGMDQQAPILSAWIYGQLDVDAVLKELFGS